MMANQLFRSTLIRRIEYATRLAQDVDSLRHQGVKGRFREIAINELFKPMLRNGIDITTGTIIDSTGKESDQMDIIIYSSDILPPFMKLLEQSCVPVEACLQVVEVKSTLNAREIKDAIKKAKSIKSLRILNSGPMTILESVQTSPPPIRPKVDSIFTLFAFNSDLVNSADNEFKRYQKYIPYSPSPINDVCVVGGGYWMNNNKYIAPSEEFDEVIAMLIYSVNSIPLWRKSRGVPKFGEYFWEQYE